MRWRDIGASNWRRSGSNGFGGFKSGPGTPRSSAGRRGCPWRSCIAGGSGWRRPFQGWFLARECLDQHTRDRLGEEPAVVVTDHDHRHVRRGSRRLPVARGTRSDTPGSSPATSAPQ